MRSSHRKPRRIEFSRTSRAARSFSRGQLGLHTCYLARVRSQACVFLFARGIRGAVLSVACANARNARAAAGLDAKALDLLIEGGKRNLKSLRCLGLIPIRLFEHVENDPSLDLFQYLKKRGGCTVSSFA